MISPGDVAAAALWVTGREGGKFVSDPYPSRWGISLQYHPELTLADIQAMTQERAAAIFSQQYWLAVWDPLPQYFAIPVLSFAVVEGPGQADFAIQRALGIPADGKIGPQTISAAYACDKAVFLESYFGACMARFMGSPRWALDGIGWCRRQVAATVAALS